MPVTNNTVSSAIKSHSEYITPSLQDLQHLLWTRRGASGHVDQVWPRIYLGDKWAAKDKRSLQSLQITHILNAADGKYNVCTGARYYRDKNIIYHGVEAFDTTAFDISPFFYSAAKFIREALEKPGEAQSRRMPVTNNTVSSAIKSHSEYITPSLQDLQHLLWTRRGASGHVDQVWPRIYLGDKWAAKDKRSLQSLHITHILNAADGKYNVCTGARYYSDMNIIYHGVEAFDTTAFDISPFFYSAAKFIREALEKPGGKVLVHCAMGLSRSATLVLAFLMIYENKTLVDALKAVSEHRNISPNMGFLGQLRKLDMRLNDERKLRREYTARDKGTLLNLGITHIVNAAHGIYHINTGAKHYSGTQMHYLGVEADDDPEFDLSPFFYPTAKFIRAGLNSPKGKVFVNCAMGVSRSATLVLAYLMICQNVTLLEAIKAVCEHRDVFPNSGFLSQLRQLDLALTLERRKKKKPQ
ncbi:UNVERIFIED_CONTAM: hypothetical protein FKN15_021283 [Acipenser sinensis]